MFDQSSCDYFSDVNECSDGSHRCDMSAICTNTDGSHTCECDIGYLGDGHICSGKATKKFKFKWGC